jgi:hypothetical protein
LTPSFSHRRIWNENEKNKFLQQPQNLPKIICLPAELSPAKAQSTKT